MFLVYPPPSKWGTPSNAVLKSYFGKFGGVSALEKAASCPIGHVFFSTAEGTNKAFAEKRHFVSGHRILVYPSKRRNPDPEAKKPTSSTATANASTEAPVTNGGIVFLVYPPPLTPGEPSNAVLKSYFKKFGSVLALEKEAECPIGHVFFNSGADVQSVLSESNHFVDGRFILVYPSEDPLPEH